MLVSVLTFALGSVAQAGHDHLKERAQHQACSYCIGYAHLADSSTTVVDIPATLFKDEAPVTFTLAVIPLRDQIVAQPRAPPTL